MRFNKYNSLEYLLNYMDESCDTAQEILRSGLPAVKSKSIAYKAANMEVNLDYIKEYCGKEFGSDLDICIEVVLQNTTYGLDCLQENYLQMSEEIKNSPKMKLEIFSTYTRYSASEIIDALDMKLSTDDCEYIIPVLTKNTNKFERVIKELSIVKLKNELDKSLDMSLHNTSKKKTLKI